MSDKIIQCCYSNLVSESGASGWQTAAASPEMTLHMLDVYRKQQDANVASQLPLDEKGEPLNMYELVADGEFIYVTRVTYGLEDVRGRRIICFPIRICFLHQKKCWKIQMNF